LESQDSYWLSSLCPRGEEEMIDNCLKCTKRKSCKKKLLHSYLVRKTIYVNQIHVVAGYTKHGKDISLEVEPIDPFEGM